MGDRRVEILYDDHEFFCKCVRAVNTARAIGKPPDYVLMNETTFGMIMASSAEASPVDEGFNFVGAKVYMSISGVSVRLNNEISDQMIVLAYENG